VDSEIFLNTDHKLIQFSIGELPKAECKEYWDFKGANWNAFTHECNNLFSIYLTASNQEGHSSESTVDADYREICRLIQLASETTLNKKRVNKHSKGWWCRELTSMVKTLRKAKRKLNARYDPANYQAYVKSVDKFQELTESYKNSYWARMFSQLDRNGNDNALWRIVNRYN
ncbi:unnamed protein product, partial [Owenia fusiformis]